MGIIKTIGIIAISIFLLSYVGDLLVGWLVKPGDTEDLVEEILEYIAAGSLALGQICGIIALFS